MSGVAVGFAKTIGVQGLAGKTFNFTFTAGTYAPFVLTGYYLGYCGSLVAKAQPFTAGWSSEFDLCNKDSSTILDVFYYGPGFGGAPALTQAVITISGTQATLPRNSGDPGFGSRANFLIASKPWTFVAGNSYTATIALS